MIAFFVLGTVATKLGYRIKAARGIAQEKGGARGWRNAWANGGVPALLAVLAGHGAARGRATCSALAYAASVATAAADTCSSEIGKAYGRRTFLITTLRPVPPGTEGAVSLEGTLGGLAGRAARRRARASRRGPLSAGRPRCSSRVAGLLGSLAESVIGTVAGTPRLAGQRPAERRQHRDRRRSLVCGSRSARDCLRPMSKLKTYVDFARPFTLLPPALGVVSGAVTAWGAHGTRSRRSRASCCCRCCGAR